MFRPQSVSVPMCFGPNVNHVSVPTNKTTASSSVKSVLRETFLLSFALGHSLGSDRGCKKRENFSPSLGTYGVLSRSMRVTKSLGVGGVEASRIRLITESDIDYGKRH